ncbi:MAG: hypothetical protein JW708_04745 [Vallitaleaceae bacterium]|nr:hypothetical protein [Vallitaleaceae bacterium]
MADQVQAKKKSGFGKVILGIVLALIALIAIFIILLKFDVASLGTEIIGPKIQSIPGASLILPEMPEEVIAEENQTLSYDNEEQIIEMLKVTENMLKEKELEAEKLIEQISLLQAENERLKVFEQYYMDYEAQKAEFDNMIVSETDPTLFAKWYEEMNPDTAAKIYESLQSTVEATDELDQLVATYGEMKADQAAGILSEMSTTRIGMVANIIKHLEVDKAAAILGAMDTKLASRITAYLYPEE